METTEGAARPTVESRTPSFNVSCQTCRISKTYLTLQGVSSFEIEHEGHNVIEGRLFEHSQTPKKPEDVAEEASMAREEDAPEVVAASVEVLTAREENPQVKEGADAVAPEMAPEMAPTPLPQEVQSAETQPKEIVAAAPSLLSENDFKEPLLLARSSYIGDSDEKRIDALRVSRALKEFRWNVEPPYVIGVMVDDNLSVETNIGVISSSMVERVEKLGYKFVAVNAPQGSPVAWFKREAEQALEGSFPVGDAERMMQISHGKRTYDEDKAVWEESFVSLLMSVKDMDVEKLKRVTDIIKSDRPEPELQS
jgi:hypothetical protein